MSNGDVNPGDRGYRRMRLAAVAGSLYRSGQQAVTDIKDQYAQARTGLDSGDGHGRPHIPGAFPDVSIASQGNEQMVLFPSYAKRHVKRDWSQPQPYPQQGQQQGATRDEDYWKQEWEKAEDEKAIVDVDIRGWVYSPQSGPMTRRNRMAIGLARQLSGIPAPRADTNAFDGSGGGSSQLRNQSYESRREQESIEQEAAQIERRGQQEKRVAYQGGYSETPQISNVEGGTMEPYKAKRNSGNFSAPGSPTHSATQYSTTSNAPTEMTEAELAMANANLMARIAPFMVNPLVSLPITAFFYNDEKSQSKQVMTNDAGHFILRAPLEFVPTHVRVLANENLSAIQEIKITEPHGVSLISDVDDTIKRSNISGGAKEIFRNTFVRDLGDLMVEGVKEWYNELHDLGVSIHYCSNSPWQLYPVLASYFKLVGLPPGSLHLKQYSGMYQGIFEPVAERKKTTLERLMRDFPQRQFILVGDSGEADLEVYTELALANPGRILAIFIRDVTTPETPGFFESSFNGVRKQASSRTLNEARHQAPPSIRQKASTNSLREKKTPAGPPMGDLIDFSEEPESTKSQSHTSGSASELLATKKKPPPRPAKPAALRSNSSLGESNGTSKSNEEEKPPPLPARKNLPGGGGAGAHPLAQIQNSSSQSVGSSRSGTTSRKPVPNGSAGEARNPPPPPPPRRRGTPASVRSNANSDIDFDPLPPPTAAPPKATKTTSWATQQSPATSPPGSPRLGPQNRKLELWNRRLERAHEQLDALGVSLYTWRRGQDVVKEAVGIVNQAHRDMQRKGKDMRQLERAAKQ